MRLPAKSLIRLANSTLLIILLGQRAGGQNLVPNPSFEDVNICAEFAQPCSPSAWFYLSRRLTTGYFPRYRSATGSRHLQLVAASRQSANRQYWETVLLCPLEPGEQYTVTLHIAGPRNATELSTSKPDLRDLGLWFTGRFIFVVGDSILQPPHYLSFVGAAVKDLKNGWFEVRKDFIATGKPDHLILGNFTRMANIDIMDQRNIANPTIDILVDDLSIIPKKSNTCAIANKMKDSLYAVRRRHSVNHPEDMQPDEPDDEHDDTGKDTMQKNRPDTVPPKTSRPIADTIIVHNIQFDFDKYLVQNPDTLQRYRTLLTRPGITKILVVGFTDDVGSDAYNLDLSQKRANEVARLIAERFSISPSLIASEGRGISKAYPTRDLNRRVEIYIFHDGRQ
jgi:outer membrane protein OmpA-like peptidoglycan-associated protein